MKRIFRPVLWRLILCLVCTCWVPTVDADDAVDPLSRKIPGGWKYDSFDEAVQQIEQKTGFKVSCSPEIREFLGTIWMKYDVNREVVPELTVQRFLEIMGDQLALDWWYDQRAETLTLNLPWTVADPRSTAELLKTVWQPGYWTDYEKDPKWQTAFKALLSNKANFDKAWKVREKSNFQHLRRLSPDQPSKPILMKRVVDKAGDKYVFILICQEIEIYPGRGSTSYYWFKDDGTLIGAGLMGTGHRCEVVDTTIDNEYGARSGQPTELQMILKMNDRDFMTATFILGGNGLELTRLMDVHGRDLNNNGLRVGQSLMTPDKR